MSDDSLKVEENEDGSLSISWDPNDPTYQLFNGLTEEEITAMLTKALMDAANDPVQ